MIKIAHLSDFHVGAHSDETWRALTEKLIALDPDYYAFTGDFTESNDVIHFQRFLDWLRDEISVSDTSSRFGLKLGDQYHERAFLVPGNHDYYENAVSLGSGTLGLVGNLSSFHQVFPKSIAPGWHFLFGKEEANLFIAQLDSNFKRGTPAIGEVCTSDLANIEKWCELGRHGLLKKNGHLLGSERVKNQADSIKIFKKSVKILILHHYIFLPTSRGSELQMGLANARDVLVRAAIDDFDLILCGHDHHDYVESLSYLTAMDKRAVKRFARMYCIRQCGQRKSRVYELDAHNNKMLPRSIRIALDFIRMKFEQVEETWGTRKYFGFGMTMDQFHRKKGIREFIRVDIKKDARLAKVVKKISEIVEEEMENVMKNRSLIHGMAPSATKKTEDVNGFNFYKVSKDRKIILQKFRLKGGQFELVAAGEKQYHAASPADYFENHAYRILNERNLVRVECAADE